MKRLGMVLGMLLLAAACDGGETPTGDRGSGRPGGGAPGGRGGPPGRGGGGEQPSAVPVEVADVVIRSISSFIETNGILEAENEVDIVSRTSGPIVELLAEEGMAVKQGRLMARIDDSEIRAQLEVARVELDESRIAHERALRAKDDELISVEVYEVARSRHESAKAQIQNNEVQLEFTRITAPFDGLVAERYVKFAEHVANGTPLFRISDFDPLLCKIQVPERDLPSLRTGQRARITVEAWPEEMFNARVLRISPVVDAATGTVRVTLEVRTVGKLRPGMFSKVFVETAVHDAVKVIPRKALSLDSIGDTVFVVAAGVAERRDIQLGFREGDSVEVVAGLQPGEQVVVVGQDGLSDGTSIQVLGAVAQVGGATGQPVNAARPSSPGPADGAPSDRAADAPPRRGPGGERPDFSSMTPEQLERAKQFMRQRGMTDEQIDERIRRSRERSGAQ